jgi:hypothetical protein
MEQIASSQAEQPQLETYFETDLALAFSFPRMVAFHGLNETTAWGQRARNSK